MMTEQKKATGPIQGCIIPLLGVVGLIALCFVFCLVLFLLNNATVGTGTGLFSFLPLG